jgi:hypothetical protein
VQRFTSSRGKIPKPRTDDSPTYSSVTFLSLVSPGAEICCPLPLAYREPQTLGCNRMSVLSHSTGGVRSLFRGLRRSIPGAGGDVMLHFARKLGADSQFHVFVGTRNRKLAGTPNQALAQEATVGFCVGSGGHVYQTVRRQASVRSRQGQRDSDEFLLCQTVSFDTRALGYHALRCFNLSYTYSDIFYARLG